MSTNTIPPGQSYDRSGAFSRAFRSLSQQLNTAQKRKMAGIMVLVFISAVLDVFGLASILPIVKLAGDPSAIHNQYILHTLYHRMGFSSDKNFLLFLILGVLVFFILKSAFGLFVNYLQTRFSGEVAYHITRRQFNKYFEMGYLNFSNIKSSVITHHIINNPLSYANWIMLPLIMIISEMIIVLLIVGGILYYDTKLFLFILCIVGPATFGLYAALKKRSARIGQELNKLFPQSLGTLSQTIGGYIDLKLAGREEHYRNRFLKLQRQYHRLNMMSYLQNLIPIRANELVALTGVVLIFLYAIYLTDNSNQAIILVSLFAAAAYRLMPSLNRIINSMVYIQKNLVAMDNLNLYTNMSEDENEEQKSEPVVFNHSIELRNLSYSFPGQSKKVIDSLNMSILKGEKVGIIGSSGSGKTTLMNLLLRFYRQTEGEILIDGEVLQNSQTKSWRSLIGYVKQDIFLMDASIRENITLSSGEYDADKLNKAIRQAKLHDFIAGLSDGVETLIGEKGSRLSGGQRQRISIARSLYRDASVLIFDEATSALDNQTEAEVSESIDSLSESKKTIFIIAHRITTLKNCDRIYELDSGKLSGVYSYHELLEKIL